MCYSGCIMAKIVNIHEAKTQFSKLIARVQRGEEVVIGKAGKPVAKLVTVVDPERASSFGSLQGQIRIADDFDSVDTQIEESFYDSEVEPK